MTDEIRTRMWFVVVHSLVAVPLWAALYASKDVWIYGAFTVAHATLLGLALGVLFGHRIANRIEATR